MLKLLLIRSKLNFLINTYCTTAQKKLKKKSYSNNYNKTKIIFKKKRIFFNY